LDDDARASKKSAFDRWIVLWVIAGCALRLSGLGVHSLWYDELCSVDVARAADPIAVLRLDHHPPLFFYLLRWWTKIGGQSDVWLRLLPAICSCVSLALFAQWANAISGNAARLAVALFAVAPFQVWHGQELRAYPLLEVGVLAALIGAQFMRRDRVALGAALVVAGQAIAFGAHYMGAMLLPAISLIALVLWLSGRSTLRRAISLIAACAAGIAAWSPFLIQNFGTQRGASWGSAVHLGWRDLAELPVRHILIENASVPMPWLAGLYAVALAMLALWGCCVMSVARRRDCEELCITATFFGPLIGALAAVVLLHSGFQPKYVFVASPATAVMIALGVGTVPWARARTIVGVIVVAGALSLSLWHKTGNLREDYRSACSEIEAAWRPGDSIVSITGTIEPFSSASLRHYLRARPEMLASIVSEQDIAVILQRVQADKSRLHVVYRDADYANATMTQVQRALVLLERSPDRFRIIRSLWQAPPR
jgi:uncharacterized membrane protein